MAGVNKVILIGRLGKDPEVRYLANGTAVCSFSVATSETWKDKTTGEKQEKTEWSNIVVWGKLGEICGEYLSKGKQCYVEGSLQTRQWEKDGQTHYTTEVKAVNVQFLGDRAEPTERINSSKGGIPKQDITDPDSIPF